MCLRISTRVHMLVRVGELARGREIHVRLQEGWAHTDRMNR